MKIKQLKLGPMDNFSYVIWDEGLNEAAVIDPAWQPEAIEAFLQKEKLALKLLLLTHAHPDHANAAGFFLKQEEGLALTLHKDDAFMLEGALKPQKLLIGDEALILGRITLKVLHTPGHTPGSVCYAAAVPGGKQA